MQPRFDTGNNRKEWVGTKDFKVSRNLHRKKNIWIVYNNKDEPKLINVPWGKTEMQRRNQQTKCRWKSLQWWILPKKFCWKGKWIQTKWHKSRGRKCINYWRIKMYRKPQYLRVLKWLKFIIYINNFFFFFNIMRIYIISYFCLINICK